MDLIRDDLPLHMGKCGNFSFRGFSRLLIEFSFNESSIFILLGGVELDSVLSFFSLFVRQNIESSIPIMPPHLWCFARFSSRAPTFYPLHYSTQFTHQSLLNRPSSIR